MAASRPSDLQGAQGGRGQVELLGFRKKDGELCLLPAVFPIFELLPCSPSLWRMGWRHMQPRISLVIGSSASWSEGSDF